MFSRTERLNSTFSCKHHADLATQPGGIGHREIHAVDHHPPAFRHIEPLHQLGEGALARPRRADDADDLPGRHVEADVVQHFPPVEAIAKRDVVETDIAADRRQARPRRRVSRLSRGIEDVAQPLHRQPRLVKVLPDLRKPQDRRADPAGQHVEGDELADRQAAVDHQSRAEIQDSAVTTLLTNCTIWLAVLPRLRTRKLAPT